MNIYPIKFYSKNDIINGNVITNATIQNIREYVIPIDLCSKHLNVTTNSHWIGFVENVHCLHPLYINFYKEQHMNLIITSQLNHIDNSAVPIGYIHDDLFDLISYKYIDSNTIAEINYMSISIYNFVPLIVSAIIILSCISKFILFICLKFKKYKLSNKYKKTIKFTDKNNEKTCTICIEDFKKNENICILHCKHCYHCECIDDWINQKGIEYVKCPNCNKLIYSELDEPLVPLL